MISSQKTKQNILSDKTKDFFIWVSATTQTPKGGIKSKKLKNHLKNLLDKIQIANRTKNSKVKEESKAKDIEDKDDDNEK